MLGCMCSGKQVGLSGMGDAFVGNRGLSDVEVLAFLARNPVIAARVSEFASIVANVGYNQAPQPPGGIAFWDYSILSYWLQQLPGWIPSWGLAVWDSSFGGWVVIFPDASGNLRYTLSDNAGTAAQINSPTYESPTPPGQSPLDSIFGVLALGALGFVLLQAKGLLK